MSQVVAINHFLLVAPFLLTQSHQHKIEIFFCVYEKTNH